MHFLLQLYEGMVATGIRWRSCYRDEPTINAPSDGGRSWTPQSVSHRTRGSYPLLNVHPTGRDAWTDAEDSKLLVALEEHGKRWNVISGCIKGRPAVQCRNRFLSHQRAGKVSEDGKALGGAGADRNAASDTDTMNVRATILRTRAGLSADTFQKNDGISDHLAMDIDAELDSSISSTLTPGSPPPPSSCPSSPDSVSSAEPSLPASDAISATSLLPSASTVGLESARMSTDSHGALIFSPTGGTKLTPVQLSR